MQSQTQPAVRLVDVCSGAFGVDLQQRVERQRGVDALQRIVQLKECVVVVVPAGTAHYREEH